MSSAKCRPFCLGLNVLSCYNTPVTNPLMALSTLKLMITPTASCGAIWGNLSNFIERKLIHAALLYVILVYNGISCLILRNFKHNFCWVEFLNKSAIYTFQGRLHVFFSYCPSSHSVVPLTLKVHIPRPITCILLLLPFVPFSCPSHFEGTHSKADYMYSSLIALRPIQLSLSLWRYTFQGRLHVFFSYCPSSHSVVPLTLKVHIPRLITCILLLLPFVPFSCPFHFEVATCHHKSPWKCLLCDAMCCIEDDLMLPWFLAGENGDLISLNKVQVG